MPTSRDHPTRSTAGWAPQAVCRALRYAPMIRIVIRKDLAASSPLDYTSPNNEMTNRLSWLKEASNVGSQDHQT